MNVSVQGTNGDGGTLVLAGGNAGSGGGVTVNANLDASGVGTGFGGSITIQSQAGGQGLGSINLNGNLSANSGANGTAAGQIGATIFSPSGVAGPAINVNGSLSTTSATGTGGGIFIDTFGVTNPINVGSSNSAATLNAQGGAGGGSIFMETSGGTTSDINVSGGSSVLAGSSGAGGGGTIVVVASGNVFINGANSVVDASSATASGGQITLQAGVGSTGVLNINGNVSANSVGANNNASITLSQNSTQAMQIGVSPGAGVSGTGIVSANNPSGTGGSLTISNANGDLNVTLNETVSLMGSSVTKMGTLSASSSGNVNISGPGALSAYLNGSGVSYTVSSGGAGANVGIQQVSSTAGNVSLTATSSSGSLVFASGSSLQASQGSATIGAPTITFNGTVSVGMDNAGTLTVNSGNQTNSLALNFAAGSSVTFNVTQGGSVRPGNIAIGPGGTGSLSLNAAGGPATVDFNGGTVSMTSSGGAVNLGANLSINSNAFDTTQNLGMEIIATNGDVNLNSAIAARQLNVSTVGSGNINLAAEINAPTVVLTVGGNSSINQTGPGSLGIGTLVLQAGTGSIGSAASPISANVLELQVTSGGSAYINNDSTVDVKATSVAGTFVLNNQGDIAIENSVSTGTLNATATNGSISVFNPTSGSSGVTLTATGTGSNIDVEAGIQLSSSAGNITLNTNNLVLDGSIQTQGAAAQVQVDSSSNLVLSGAGGQITASGANSLINISGSSSVTFSTSYILNAGSSGNVQIQTSSLGGTGVVLASSTSLTAAGGSQLTISTNAITFNSGSSVSLSNPSVGLAVQSVAGSPLTVNVSGSNIPITSTAGGAVQFVAGAGGGLTFTNPGAGIDSLSVSGGNLVTSSSAADTTLSSVNLNSTASIQITVSGANLNLNGNNVTSSQNGGVIVLQDPNGIALNGGGGTIGFSSGSSGSILVEAESAGANLQINGATNFNAGSAGAVSFNAAGSVSFAGSSVSTINGGGTINIDSPTINFGSQSQVVATGASSINLTSPAGLDVVLPATGSATLSTSGGAAINISAPAGNPIVFSQASGGSGSTTLNMNGAPVTISTSNANVTINANVVVASNNAVNVQTPGGTLVNNGLINDPGGTTVIQAAGNLVINHNVNANNLIIETTANNGNITFEANVNVTDALTVTANGSGSLIEGTGLLTAANILLESQSGDIGSKDKFLQVATPDLSVSTSGKAYVTAIGAVDLTSYSVGGGIHLRASGNITVGSSSAQTLALNSDATFNAGATGTVTITASNTVSIAPGVHITVNKSSLNLTAPNISMGEADVVNAKGNLSVSGDVLSTGKITFISRDGNLQVSGQVSALDCTLATENNGNISVSGNISASHNLNVSADGSGNVSQSSGVLSAGNNLSLSSDVGNIGANGSPLNVAAGNIVSAETFGHGTVNLASSSSSLTVDNSFSGGSFTLSTAGNLTIGSVITANGSISLSGSGAVQVEKNDLVWANQGNLLIQNTNTQSGTITVGKNSDLIAYSNSAGLGNVDIVIGNIPTNPVKGSAPSGLTVAQSGGGKVYFGSNGITVSGKNSEAQAQGANVIFSTGSEVASAISIQNGVYILGDPPSSTTANSSNSPTFSTGFNVSPATLVTSLPVSLGTSFAAPFNNTVPVANIRTALPSVTAATVPSSVSNAGNFTAAAQSSNPALLFLPSGGALSAGYNASNLQSIGIESSTNEDIFEPIACATAVTEAAIQQGSAAAEEIEQHKVAASSVYVGKHRYESGAGSMEFHKGEILVDAHRDTEIRTAIGQVFVAAGASAILKSDGKGIEIYNLTEEHLGDIKVRISGKDFTLNAGQRLLIGQGSKVAVRNEAIVKHEGKSVQTAEYPMLSLINASETLANLLHSNTKEDRQLGSRLIKMAACLNVITAGHGAFRN